MNWIYLFIPFALIYLLSIGRFVIGRTHLTDSNDLHHCQILTVASKCTKWQKGWWILCIFEMMLCKKYFIRVPNEFKNHFNRKYIQLAYGTGNSAGVWWIRISTITWTIAVNVEAQNQIQMISVFFSMVDLLSQSTIIMFFSS